MMLPFYPLSVGDWLLLAAILLGYIIAIGVIVWCAIVLLRAFLRWLLR